MYSDIKKLYNKVKFKNLNFVNNSNSDILKFGFICPGAIKTVKYLMKNKSNIKKDVLDLIIAFTDLLFFIEIIFIYKNYIPKSLYKEALYYLKDPCKISKNISDKISEYFVQIPDNIRINIPDNFYQVRHKTLICSNDKKMAEDRIKFLTNFYENKTSSCNGKRDGVSGCRDCCFSKFKKYNQNYYECVNKCMNYT